MKYYETSFEEYTQSVARHNYHPELQQQQNPTTNHQPQTIQTMQNRIYYGASGTGKYSQILHYLKRFSPSALKYDKKMTIQTEKTSYQYRFSDVHYEIDMALLGCNAKALWEVFFNQVVDILSVKAGKSGILVCKNFHCIHTELLEIFFSYMKQYQYPDPIFNKNGLCLKYVLITEHVSFIPSSILNHCKIIPTCRPSKTTMVHRKHPQIAEAVQTMEAETVDNLKALEMFQYNTAGNLLLQSHHHHHNTNTNTNKQHQHNNHLQQHLQQHQQPPPNIFNIVCNALLEEMKTIINNNTQNNPAVDFMKCRNLLYDVSIYQLDIMECLWFLMGSLIRQGYLMDIHKIGECLNEITEFLKYYNNNYRTIYHFESIFYFIQLKLTQSQ